MKEPKPYQTYSTAQFLEDERFRDWVLAPDADSVAFWKRFIADHPGQAEKIMRARALLLGIHKHFDHPGLSDTELERNLQDTLSRVKERSGGGAKRRLRWVSGIAATLVFLLSLSIWWGLPAEKIVYATDFGEWKTITLPDGSVVQLNANSRLIWHKPRKAGADRIVQLEGEAFFTVTRKPETGARFVVHTSDLEVEVLGTAFNVHARGEATGVFLEEGKVALYEHGRAEKLTHLKPGDYVAYSRSSDAIVERHRSRIEGSRVDSWKDGSISFQREYAFQILKKLEEIYGLEADIRNESIYERQFNLSLPLEDLDTVIPILEKTMGVSVRKNDNRLVIE